MSTTLVSLPCSSNVHWIRLNLNLTAIWWQYVAVHWFGGYLACAPQLLKNSCDIEVWKNKVNPVQDVEVIWWKWGSTPFIFNFRTGWRWVRQKRQCYKPGFHYVLTRQEYTLYSCAYSLRIFCITEVFYSSWSIFKRFSFITTIRRFGVPASRGV
jgi:hypothetical protein